MQATYALTLATATNGALAASPGEMSYDEDATVVVTAAPRAGYRLTAWGGDCATTPATSSTCTLTMEVDKTVSATFGKAGPAIDQAPAPELIAVTTGNAGEVLLEWHLDPAPADVTGWQYRQQEMIEGVGGAWSAWTNVPGATAATRSHRVTGLRDLFYGFEVRAVAGSRTGRAAASVEGAPAYMGADGIPQMLPGDIIEGGRTWRLGGGLTVVDVPAGTRLEFQGGGLDSTGTVSVSFRDVASGAVQVIDIDRAAGVGRYPPDANAAAALPGSAAASARDVDAIFDQILASARLVPVTVKQMYALTLATATNGALTASPDEASYEEGAAVVVTATPRAGYRLTGWGGACATTPATSSTCTLTMDADKTVSATFGTAGPAIDQAAAPELIAVTTGNSGEVLLEWHLDPVPAGVTGWQYRQRARRGGTTDGPWEWGAWKNVPGATAATRSYLLTNQPRRVYHFEVRAVAGSRTGKASEGVKGRPAFIGGDGIPQMRAGYISEGGRAWRIHAGPTVVDVPAGTRLLAHGVALAGGRVIVSFGDVASGAAQVVDIGRAEGVGRYPPDPSEAAALPGGAAASARDVDAIFDQILASARLVPVAVKPAYALTLATATNGTLTASPDEASYDDGATVVVTATPQAGYHLTGWGGDCATTPATSSTCMLTMDADRTASVTFAAVASSGPLSLIVVSDGSTDSLLLEWTGGPANATRWQYRQRRWENMQPLAWEAWADLPNSSLGTRSHELAGLRADTAYDFEVRAVVGTVAGAPSVNGRPSPRLGDHPAGGTTHKTGALPGVYPDQIVEGDGRTQWRIHYLSIAITIPDGVRLVGGGAFVIACVQDLPCADRGTSLIDYATNSVLAFSDEGVELNRHIVESSDTSSPTQASPSRSVHDLFDQLMASVRVVPQ